MGEGASMVEDVSMSDAKARAEGENPAKIVKPGVRARAVAVAAFALALSGASAAPAVHDMVVFDNSPFPFAGTIPTDADQGGGLPFLQHDPDGKAFHLSPRGGKLYVDSTYSDRRSLLFIPPTFDATRADAALVIFFHGNLATLSAVESQQRVSSQLALSHLNAVLVAPQMAVKAPDSSAGRFYERGFLETYLREAASRLADRSGGRFDAAAIDRLPVIIVAFSGGYLPTAFSLHYAQQRGDTRIAGVILFDAMFGETRKFEEWIARERARTFFVSTYSKASRPLNEAVAAALRLRGVEVRDALNGPIAAGDVIFQPSLGATHEDFVTQAWITNPLADVLARIRLDASR